jgi:hypothetical protein
MINGFYLSRKININTNSILLEISLIDIKFLHIFIFLYIFISNRLSSNSHLFLCLLMINIFIGLIASYSWRVFHGHLERVNDVMGHFNLFKQNRSIIFEYIKLNSSQLIIDYSELNMYPQIDLCNRYNLSMKLINLSTFYTAFLIYILFDSVLLSTLIIGISSIFVVNTNLLNNGQIIHLFQLILVLINFGILCSYSSSENSNNQLDRIAG